MLFVNGSPTVGTVVKRASCGLGSPKRPLTSTGGILGALAADVVNRGVGDAAEPNFGPTRTTLLTTDWPYPNFALPDVVWYEPAEFYLSLIREF